MQAVQREALDLHISFPVFHVCFTLCSQALCCRASCRFVSILSAFFFVRVCLLIVALLRRLPPWQMTTAESFLHGRLVQKCKKWSIKNFAI